MPSLPNAPLIEAIFELRWGGIQTSPTNFQFKLSPTESELLPGQFIAAANSAGFVHYERINPGAPPLPHLVMHRYRQAPNKWPCYQLGLGIFTANQVNDGYSWESFKATVLNGYELLEKAHGDSIQSANLTNVDLRYQDAFILENEESAKDFLVKKIRVGFDLPTKFVENSLMAGEPRGHRISFSVPISSPTGELAITIGQAQINDQNGFVMDTLVRTQGQDIKELNTETLGSWLDNAHVLQKHTFDTLIDPRLQETFK